MSETLQLPPKPEVALALLQTAMSVYVHLDPRPDDVRVPAWFKKQPQLVLQVGLNMAVPIPDLDVGNEALTCTLSFNRKPEYCWIPWSAIYGLVGDDGRGMIWPDSVPAEVAAAAEGRATKAPEKRPRLHLAGSEGPTTKESPTDDATPVREASNPGGEPLPPGVAPKKKRATRAKRAEPATAAPADQPAQAPQAAKPAVSDEARGSKRELPPYLRIVK